MDSPASLRPVVTNKYISCCNRNLCTVGFSFCPGTFAITAICSSMSPQTGKRTGKPGIWFLPSWVTGWTSTLRSLAYSRSKTRFRSVRRKWSKHIPHVLKAIYIPLTVRAPNCGSVRLAAAIKGNDGVSCGWPSRMHRTTWDVLRREGLWDKPFSEASLRFFVVVITLILVSQCCGTNLLVKMYRQYKGFVEVHS